MSTSRKLGGAQFSDARQKRKDVIAFYRNLTKTPGAPGVVATAIWQTLVKIHKDSTLNGYEKEREFRRIIQSLKTPAAPVAAPGASGVGTG